MTLDAQGNLYGTTVDGGANNMGTVFELIELASIVPEPRSIVALGQAAAASWDRPGSPRRLASGPSSLSEPSP